jgi:hypothetical protein
LVITTTYQKNIKLILELENGIMSEEKNVLADKMWEYIVTSRGLIESTFFSIGIWALIYSIGWMLLLTMEGSLSVGPGFNSVYGFVNEFFRQGAFIYLLFVSMGCLFPIISYLTYKRENSLIWVILSGMIIGAFIFTWGTMNHPELVHLKPILFRIIYGAAMGLAAGLVANLFFLTSFYQRGM